MSEVSAAGIRTFLIADVRAYTRFTQEHGDEAAARLATRFADIVSRVVPEHLGELVELRGDEALVAFTSARHALRAAIELQGAFSSATSADPALPLRVGIGLDAGEAVPVAGGYRGGALNLAARLCALAGPGEVLASEGVAHLARKMDRIAYVEREMMQLKGFTELVRVVEIRRESEPSAQGVAPEVADGPTENRLPIGGFLGALPSNRLVARSEEMERILSSLDRVASGEGQLTVLAGEPGVGKTRLAQEVILQARNRGFVVASGRCYEPYAAVPFYPFREGMATAYVRAPTDVQAQVPARWAQLARLLPDVALPTPGPAANSYEEQQRVFSAVTGFLMAISKVAPVAMLFDDLQWADGSSLQLLQHLARHTRGSAIFLLATFRDVDVGRQHPLDRALLDLSRERLVDRVTIERLDHEATHELVATAMGGIEISSEFANLIYRRTDGNPFFTEEVVRALVERGDVYREGDEWRRLDIEQIEVPENVRAVVGQRLSRLSPNAQELLHEAGVLGQTFAFDDLALMSGQDEDTVEAALQESIEAGLLRPLHRDNYGFSHGLIQQTLYEEVPPRRRRRLHLAAGEMLERLPGHVRERRTAEFAWHFSEGGDAVRGYQYSMRAGDQAEAVWAHHDALTHYMTALRLVEELSDPEREAAVRERLGGLFTAMIRYADALEMNERAAVLFRSLGNVDSEARVVAQLGRVHLANGTVERAVPQIQDAIERFTGNASVGAVAGLHSSLARCLAVQGRYGEALTAAEHATALARQAGDRGVEAEGEVTRGSALAKLGRWNEGLTVLNEAVADAEKASDLFSACRGLQWISSIYLARGDLDTSRERMNAARVLGERMDNQRQVATTLTGLAVNAFVRGDSTEAGGLAQRAVAIMQRLKGYWLPVLRSAHISLLFAPGEWEAMPGALKECINLSESLEGLSGIRAQRLRVEEDLLAGRGEKALALVESLQDRQELQGDESEVRWLLAWALLDAGNEVAAERVILTHEEEATRDSLRLHLVLWRRVHGMLHVHRREWSDAELCFRDALTLARAMPYPYAEARTLEERARMWIRRGEGRQAVESLDAARRLFDGVGATSDLQRVTGARSELLLR